MAATSKRSNVRDYRKKRRTSNVGIIAFAIMFLYLAIIVYIYISKDTISIYQVTTEGSLTVNNEYSGIILRNEKVVNADRSGYIRYFLPSGEKTGVGDLVYSLDENGDVTKALADKSSYTETLKKLDLTDLKQQITNFAYDFSSDNFKDIYNFKTYISSSIFDLMNYNDPAYLEQLLSTVEADGMFKLYYSDKTANVAYYFDGYEQLTPTNVKPENFNRDAYVRNTVNSTDFVEAGAHVYKYIEDESWNVVFQLSEADIIRYTGLNSLTIFLPNYDLTFTVPFSIVENETGKYGCLSFDRYMSHFIDSRYIDFEILYEDKSGLKVPISSVISKDFYIIPVSFYFTSQDYSGFYLETYDANGNATAEYIEPTIYNSTDTHYYVDMSAFEEGSYLINITTGERYRIGSKAPLSGVYNVNKGYTIFRKVEIIDQNEEYYIINKATKYGITLYDHIILNGKVVVEGQVIYQ